MAGSIWGQEVVLPKFPHLAKAYGGKGGKIKEITSTSMNYLPVQRAGLEERYKSTNHDFFHQKVCVLLCFPPCFWPEANAVTIALTSQADKWPRPLPSYHFFLFS